MVCIGSSGELVVFGLFRSQLVMEMLLVLVQSPRLGDGCIARLLLVIVIVRLASYCVDDAVVRRTSVVQKGLHAGDFDGDATWELLGRLLASFFRMVFVPGTAAGRTGWCAGRMAAISVCTRSVIGIDASVSHPP